MTIDIEVKLKPNWSKAFVYLEGLPSRLDQALDQAVGQEAQFLRGKMVEGMDAGAPGGQKYKAHSPLTIAIRQFTGQKQSGKVMIQSTALRNSIVAVRSGPGWFIGVRRGSRGAGGKSGVDLAKIHEEGRTYQVPLTPKMRRFLFAALNKAGLPPLARAKGAKGSSTITIKIPARPTIGPVIQQMDANAMRQRVLAHVAKAL